MENKGNKNSNVIAIVGFILSFFLAVAGLICSIIGLVKSKELNDGKGFSIAGIVISSLRIILMIVFFLFGLTIVFKESRDVINNVGNEVREKIEESINPDEINEESIFDSNTIEIYANNKNNKITFEYFIEEYTNECEDSECDEEEINIIKENGDYVYSTTNVKVKINDNYVKDFKVLYQYNRTKTPTINYLTKENVEVLKGKDKDYFVLLVPEADQWTDGRTNPTIVNGNGENLYSIEYPINTGMQITDTKSIMYGKGMYYIDNDKLYFIKPLCEEKQSDKFTVYTLTINNDKVNVNEGNIVEGFSVGGLACPES